MSKDQSEGTPERSGCGMFCVSAFVMVTTSDAELAVNSESELTAALILSATCVSESVLRKC